jgi:regulator of sirC expression with transglutaminase-like and TPR domain
MLDDKELDSLIYLLEDTDETIVSQVEERLLSFGMDVIPFLEQKIFFLDNERQIHRVQLLLKKLKYDSLIDYFKIWVVEGATDLLGAVINIAGLKYPELDRQVIENQIDKIKLDAWLELNPDLTSLEKVKILNHVFFEVHKYQGDAEDYHNPDNSYINKVLDRRRGNPISLAIIYSLVAQRLNIPIYGVNLPQHFVLGYKAGDDWEVIKAYNEHSSLGQEDGSEVLFYINPFSQGLILSQESITSFLKQIDLEARPEYFRICSNIEIVQRIIRNLMHAYEKDNDTARLEILRAMMEVLE